MSRSYIELPYVWHRYASISSEREKKLKIDGVEFVSIMSNKFSVCIPDYINGLIWCQHPNGSWAPPFQMSDRRKKAKDSSEDESDAELEA